MRKRSESSLNTMGSLSIMEPTRRKKWSNTYKKRINCKNPKGFSQKQYCKYGKGTRRSASLPPLKSHTNNIFKGRGHRGKDAKRPTVGAQRAP